MFGRKSKNDIHTSLEYIINTALPEFVEGRYYYAEVLQRVFYIDSVETKEIQKMVATVFVELLSNVSAKKWMQLDEECRGSVYSYAGSVDMSIDWRKCEPDRKKYKYLSDAEYNAILCMGTFHHNGYYREICLRYLSKLPGNLSYYIVRMNDWVNEIRETAYLLLCGKLKHCDVIEIVNAMPMFERLLWSQRRSEQRYGEIVSLVCIRLQEDVSEQHLPVIVKRELLVRGAFYRFIAKEKILSKEMMQKMLDMEPFGAYKDRILLGIFHIYGCSEKEVEVYLTHRSSNVRYHALMQKAKLHPGMWDGIEKMLLDRSKKIREYVIYVMKKYAGFDAAEFYRNELIANGNRVALEEMGYYGKKEDIALIEKYLESDNPSVVRHALRACGRIAGSDGSNLYWKFVCGDQLPLCHEAYHIIVANRIHYGTDVLWDEYQRQKEKGMILQKHQRQEEAFTWEYIIYLLTYEPVWKRMRYMLELYKDSDLPARVRFRIELAINKRNVYSVISEDDAGKIMEYLERNRKYYPERMVEGLLFDIKHARYE